MKTTGKVIGLIAIGALIFFAGRAILGKTGFNSQDSLKASDIKPASEPQGPMPHV